MDGLLAGYSSEDDVKAAGQTAAKKKPKRKRTDKAGAASRPAKKKKRVPEQAGAPPLPDVFLNDTIETGGRVRHVGHQSGVWSGSVSVELDESVRESIKSSLNALAGKDDDWAAVASVHVSLSQQLYLQEHEIEAVATELSDALQKHRPFAASFTRYTTLINEQATTAFLAAESESKDLLALLRVVDAALTALGLPAYFENPVLHATVATKPAAGMAQPAAGVLLAPVPFAVDRVHFSAGNKHYAFELCGR
ncbi:U6 snRNA phosphodiesterase [Diplonema papillatum]|nr:U6 snRNA phosphodiesterase [Diplonema papillatum]